MLLVSMLLVYKQIPTQLPEISYVVMKRELFLSSAPGPEGRIETN